MLKERTKISDLTKQKCRLVLDLLEHKGKTPEQLQKDVEWLKNISLYGIYFHLRQAEREGLIRTEINENNELVYFPLMNGIIYADKLLKQK